MGLFGGFKAKFTKNSTNKKQPEVVCLRYNVHPEFDRPMNFETPVRINNDIKKNEVVRNGVKKKERKAVTKSAIFPDSHTSQSSLSSSTPQKSLSLNNLNGDIDSSVTKPPVDVTTSFKIQENGHGSTSNPITVSTTVSVQGNGKSIAVSDTKFGRNIEEHNGITTEKLAMVTNNHVYSTDNNATSQQHSQTTFQSRRSYDEQGTLTNGTAAYTSSTHYESNGQKNLEADQSTLIFMTQHSSRNSSIDMITETPPLNFTRSVRPANSRVPEPFNGIAKDDSTTLTFVPNHAPSDDEDDYFKVNVVKHDLNRTYSVSEDEREEEDVQDEPQFTRMGFSSQAASIFFGDGEEEEVMRPRRIQFADDEDDDRRSSGADC